MSTRRLKVPAGQLEKLGLHQGDAFHGKVEEDGSATVTVSSPDRDAASSNDKRTWRERSEAWLAGSRRPAEWTEQDIDDARYTYLMEKHVWRHRPASS